MQALSFDGLVPGSGRSAAPRPRQRLPLMIMAGEAYSVEFRGPGEMQDALEPWRALAARALEPALFADPDLILPALQHLTGGRHVSLMLVWRQTATARILRGIFPLALPRLSLGSKEARLWQPGPETAGAPLIDREDPEATIEAALRGVSARGGRYAGLTWPLLIDDGPIARALAATAARSARRLDRFAATRSVWIWAPETPDGGHGHVRTPSRTGAEAGRRVTLERARTAREVRDAIETFFVLDAVAAKAARRAPLVQDPGVASFVRTATRQFARTGRCRVDTLRIEGAAAAAAITFEKPDTVWLWATASLPEADAQRHTLLRTIAARARRGRKTLYILDEALVTEGFAAELGLRRVALADSFVSTRPGASAGTAAVHFKQYFDRGLRHMAHEGLRRLQRLTGGRAAA